MRTGSLVGSNFIKRVTGLVTAVLGVSVLLQGVTFSQGPRTQSPFPHREIAHKIIHLPSYVWDVLGICLFFWFGRNELQNFTCVLRYLWTGTDKSLNHLTGFRSRPVLNLYLSESQHHSFKGKIVAIFQKHWTVIFLL